MQRDTPRMFLWAAVGMGVLLAVLAVHLRTAMAAGGPVAVPDVPAYLGIAQWVGGDGLAPIGIPFQPGYGLLLAPLVALAQVSLLGTQGEVVHDLALAANSLAATAAVFVAGRLGWVLSGRWWVTGAAGLVAAVHPSLSSASRIAWPETLLGLTVLAITLALARATARSAPADAEPDRATTGESTGIEPGSPAATGETPGGAEPDGTRRHGASRAQWRWWSGAGLLATLAVALHARAVVLVVALVMTAVACRIGRRAWTGLGGGLSIGGATTAAALALTDTWPGARLSEATQLDRGLEPVVTVAGQLLALGGGTVGLGLIGLIAGLGAVLGLFRRRPVGDVDSFRVVLLFLGLGGLGAVLLGGWTLTGSARADAVLYGRYLDPWAVALALAALAWIATRSNGMRWSKDLSAVLAVSMAVVLAACAVVVGAAGSYDAAPRRIMTLSFSPVWAWLDERLAAVAVAALISTLLGVMLAAVALRSHAATGADESVVSVAPPASDADSEDASERTPTAATIALGTLAAAVVALGAVATVTNHRHLADVGAVARDQVVAAEAVSASVEDDGLTCLAHDRASVPDYALWLYRLELPEITHERVRLDAAERPCSELVIARDDLAQRCLNARHLVDEPAASWALWHLPGRECRMPAV